MNEFNFSMLVKKSQKHEPYELIRSYAEQHPGMKVGRTAYGKTYLMITGIKYYYDHTRIIAVSPNSEMATVYLKEKLQ